MARRYQSPARLGQCPASAAEPYKLPRHLPIGGLRADSQTGPMSSRHLQRGRDSRIDGYYVLTTVVLRRRPVFADPRCAEYLVDTLRFEEREGLSRSFAWVIMPDHIHWLMQLRAGTLARLMGTLKLRSSRLFRAAVRCGDALVAAELLRPRCSP
ncbi:transposase [Stenotrophomonas cyclobalanopsidis]|uniref:transposase n=1 Tax=Stenotrophomonas cyclobalanopsidis TaxID=2771362 RepID=UPI00319D995B